MRSVPTIDLQGLHVHIGSQILGLEQFETGVAVLARLERFGVYDLGGGLGVRYVHDDKAPSIGEYAKRLTRALHNEIGGNTDLLVEPGRSLVGPVGLTLYRIVTVKRTARTYVAVDGGMGDNLEHSLYGQDFTPLVIGRWNEEQVVADLVGRHCEAGDVITPHAALANPHVGDLIAVPVTGAYCFTMSNNYNAALRPPVVFCREGIARVGVRRETYNDLIAREVS
jgi:diaminopimelate decarboxylase